MWSFYFLFLYSHQNTTSSHLLKTTIISLMMITNCDHKSPFPRFANSYITRQSKKHRDLNKSPFHSLSLSPSHPGWSVTHLQKKEEKNIFLKGLNFPPFPREHHDHFSPHKSPWMSIRVFKCSSLNFIPSKRTMFKWYSRREREKERQVESESVEMKKQQKVIYFSSSVILSWLFSGLKGWGEWFCRIRRVDHTSLSPNLSLLLPHQEGSAVNPHPPGPFVIGKRGWHIFQKWKASHINDSLESSAGKGIASSADHGSVSSSLTQKRGNKIMFPPKKLVNLEKWSDNRSCVLFSRVKLFSWHEKRRISHMRDSFHGDEDRATCHVARETEKRTIDSGRHSDDTDMTW